MLIYSAICVVILKKKSGCLNQSVNDEIIMLLWVQCII